MSAISSTGNSKDKQINATRSHLDSAFRQHRICIETLKKTREKNNFPCKLLLFYAVECGLKYLLINKDSPRGTASLDERYRSHDLSTLWGEVKKSVRLRSSDEIKGAPQFRLKDDPDHKRHRNISQAHEAWRYGVQIDPCSEQDLVKWLEQVLSWIKEFEEEENKR